MAFPGGTGEEADEWLDIAGQFVSRKYLERAMQARTIEQMEDVFTECHERYTELEMNWIGNALSSWATRSPAEIEAGAAEFDRMIEEDRKSYLESLSEENAMLSL